MPHEYDDELEAVKAERDKYRETLAAAHRIAKGGKDRCLNCEAIERLLYGALRGGSWTDDYEAAARDDYF